MPCIHSFLRPLQLKIWNCAPPVDMLQLEILISIRSRKFKQSLLRFQQHH
jgi:hypothetical protein